MAEFFKVTGPGGIAGVDALQVSNTGANVWGIRTGTFVLDIASIAASLAAVQTVTITGVAPGDFVYIVPPAAGLSVLVAVTAAYVSATDQVRFLAVNPSVAPLDPASVSFSYIWFDLTE